MKTQKIAVVGSGISGLSAAWGLAHNNDVTLFEAEDRPGGHAHTVTVATPSGPVDVDTGFIVFNEQNYPNLTAFFQHLDVETAPSSMSFAFADRARDYEYAGSALGFFDQPRNLVNRRHWRLFNDMRRFFGTAATRVKTYPIRAQPRGVPDPGRV